MIPVHSRVTTNRSIINQWCLVLVCVCYCFIITMMIVDYDVCLCDHVTMCCKVVPSKGNY